MTEDHTLDLKVIPNTCNLEEAWQMKIEILFSAHYKPYDFPTVCFK